MPWQKLKTSQIRKAMRGLVTSLIQHERIETAEAGARNSAHCR